MFTDSSLLNSHNSSCSDSTITSEHTFTDMSIYTHSCFLLSIILEEFLVKSPFGSEILTLLSAFLRLFNEVNISHSVAISVLELYH